MAPWQFPTTFFATATWETPRNELHVHSRSLGAPQLRRPSVAPQMATRPGKHTKSYWKWPFIVDFPIKNGGFFHIVMLNYQRVYVQILVLIHSHMMSHGVIGDGSDSPDWHHFIPQKTPTLCIGQPVPALCASQCWLFGWWSSPILFKDSMPTPPKKTHKHLKNSAWIARLRFLDLVSTIWTCSIWIV